MTPAKKSLTMVETVNITSMCVLLCVLGCSSPRDAPLVVTLSDLAAKKSEELARSPDGHYVLLRTQGMGDVAAAPVIFLFSGIRSVWSRSEPRNVQQYVVANAGTVFGYLYSKGTRGLPTSDGRDRGTLDVFAFDEAGTMRTLLSLPRDPHGFGHAPPLPLSLGLLLSGDEQKLICRLAMRPRWPLTGEEWTVLDARTGSQLAHFVPLQQLRTIGPATTDHTALVKVVALSPCDAYALLWSDIQHPLGADVGDRMCIIDGKGKIVAHRELRSYDELPTGEIIAGSVCDESRKTLTIQWNGLKLMCTITYLPSGESESLSVTCGPAGDPKLEIR